jgi:hypothetical protein
VPTAKDDVEQLTTDALDVDGIRLEPAQIVTTPSRKSTVPVGRTPLVPPAIAERFTSCPATDVPGVESTKLTGAAAEAGGAVAAI